MTSRSMYAVIEPGSCFAGTLLELAMAADRVYMLDTQEGEGARHGNVVGDEFWAAADGQSSFAFSRRVFIRMKSESKTCAREPDRNCLHLTRWLRGW